MSIDALLWIGTLLFAAAMLILSAMRHSATLEAAADAAADDGETGIDLGHGWSLGGDGGN
jgi:hypothetical protein